MNDTRVSYADGSYLLVTPQSGHVQPLAAGDRFQLRFGESWCSVLVARGGYKGWYYIQEDGERGRFALGMRARFSHP